MTALLCDRLPNFAYPIACETLGIPQPTERQRIRNQIDAALVFARADFVSVDLFRVTESRSRWASRLRRGWARLGAGTARKQSFFHAASFARVGCSERVVANALRHALARGVSRGRVSVAGNKQSFFPSATADLCQRRFRVIVFSRA